METVTVIESAPLKQLQNEHVSLKAEMDFFYEIIEEIEYETGSSVFQLFAELSERVLAFIAKLKIHSKREDEALFPMMSRHLGEENNIIEVMEYEHEKAEQHLEDFMKEAEQAGEKIDENDIQSITVYAAQAYATLIQHFAKEEKFLFPLAEVILSDVEKEELERLIQVG
ncbi:hemerythrin domain-containing protein [Ferdinandcohnia sp. Marseille-Q9671]